MAIAATKLSDLAIGLKSAATITNVKYIDLGGGFPSRNTLKGSYLPASDVVPSF
jgi:diaminopimelate decarboxylase